MDHASARALLGEVVDYAGLFPPAGLAMAAAVREYATALAGDDRWMLGRFVLPAARLAEFAEARAAHSADSRWRLSAIVRDRSEPDFDAITTFNQGKHGAVVDTIEAKPSALDGIDWLAGAFGLGFDVYVEVAADADAAAWLGRIKAGGLRGKVRTGGLTADAFPAPDALVAWLDAAVRLGVPFKATAGLHHALRGDYRLTYEPAAASAPMYGYLNVLLATAALGAGEPLAVARELLVGTDRSTLAFADREARWGGVALPIDALDRARQQWLVSFGSCSFREPCDEYRALVSSS